MTLVNIDIKNVASETHPDDRVVFYSPTLREAPGGGITSTAETVVSLVDGVGEIELVPGPVTVTFQCRGIADTRPKSGTVPDEGTVDIAEVIEGGLTFTPPVVNRALDMIKSERDHLLDDMVTTVSEAVDGELGTAVRNAETAAVTAGQAAVSADGRATSAESKVDSYTPRVVALEAMGGLSPQSPVDGQTANLLSQGNTLTRNAVRSAIADSTALTPLIDFGAVGDGITDDTAAVQAALSAGVPLHWGDSGKNYRVTAMVALTAARDILWQSMGATITLDSASPVQSVLSVVLNGHSMGVMGALCINANKKSFIGLDIRNDTDTPVSLTIVDATVVNPYRSSTNFLGGDGIRARGNFDRVTIRRPVITGVRMAAGAGIEGSQGISGITISHLSATRYPRDILIDSPAIDTVVSDDTSTAWDQDAIKILGGSDTKFSIIGGVITDPGGRSVKSQATWGVVEGVKIARTLTRADGVAEIDFQLGGGQVSNVQCRYSGSAVPAVVKFTGSDTAVTPGGSVSGLKVLVENGKAPTTIVTSSPRMDGQITTQMHDVEVVGGSPQYVASLHGTATGGHTAIMSGILAAPTAGCLALGYSASTTWTTTLALSGVVCTGSAVPLFVKNSSSVLNPKISASGLRGWSNTPVDIGRLATLQTTSATSTSGWNNLVLESGFGALTPNATYYVPPIGKYRITYKRASNATFTRSIGGTSASITPVAGVYQEVAEFGGGSQFRIVGVMADITTIFEAIE